MSVEVHAGMEDADDFNAIGQLAVEDHVAATKKAASIGAELGARWPESRPVSQSSDAWRSASHRDTAGYARSPIAVSYIR